MDDKYIETAIRQVNDYFLPTAIRVLKEVEQGNEVNIQNKILNILEKNGGCVELRKIMMNLHIKRKDLDEHLKSLIDSGEIIQAPYFDGNHTATMIFITSMYESMKNTSTN